ncbi:hypothetical protein FRC03_010407 [Tulasnella sp. 419]|nr:hypothetical protein FRC03_010407 [Tulasnella sp. 419]
MSAGSYPHSVEQSSRQVSIPHIPELFNDRFEECIVSPPAPQKKPEGPQPRHPFTDALKATANFTLTDNASPAFVSTESANLDAFSTIDSNTNGTDVHRLLEASWAENPEATLKIIWNLRSIHDGKAAKTTFYHAFGWLYLKHPKTAIGNLSQLVEQVIDKPKKKKDENSQKPETDAVLEGGLSHGYYKDLLNILVLATADQLTDPTSKFPTLRPRTPRSKPPLRRRSRQPNEKGDEKDIEPVPAKAEPAIPKDNIAKLSQKLQNDNNFRILYSAVARIFATSLAKDMKILDSLNNSSSGGQPQPTLSLASKWAPSPDGSHDRHTNIVTAIALIMYANGDFKDLKGIPTEGALSQKDAQRVRGYYRRWVLSPLRKQQKIPETLMSANEWGRINYSRVPSVCFDRNKEHFFKHDEQRLIDFIQKVSEGKKTISGATLAPHELIRQVVVPPAKSKDPIKARLLETTTKIIDAQWKTLVENLRASGSLDNSMAVCDVSGSMGSIYDSGIRGRGSTDVQPILPAVALSLLLAQLAKPPFSNSFITFSENPSIVTLRSDASLAELVADMNKADWGMNTDFNAVFLKLILPMAVRHQIPKEDMIKRLFVFSDMQFDQANTQPQQWETNHQTIVREFAAAGYEIPEIVYWNLAGRIAAKPVTKDTPGVAMLSGFSGNLLKIFMENKEIEGEEEWSEVVQGEEGPTVKEEKEKERIDPMSVMKKALDLKSFEKLRVLD